MSKILGFLNGYKTYIVAVAIVGYGLYKHFFGDHLPWADVIDFIFSGAGLAAIRSALAKIGLSETK
ncbi:hypothetical protein CCP1ISM_2070002 [Azospirillaceae bacterium]